MRPTSPITRHNAQARQLAADRQRRHELRGQPSRYAGGAGVEVHVLSDIEGTDNVYNSGAIDVDGVGTTQVTAVPSATPSLSTPTAGLGIATLDGGSTVWVAVYADGQADMFGYVPNNAHTAIARRKVPIPITGGGGATADVWLIWRV